MKKQKLTLEELQVHSFITQLNDGSKEKGGTSPLVTITVVISVVTALTCASEETQAPGFDPPPSSPAACPGGSGTTFVPPQTAEPGDCNTIAICAK